MELIRPAMIIYHSALPKEHIIRATLEIEEGNDGAW